NGRRYAGSEDRYPIDMKETVLLEKNFFCTPSACRHSATTETSDTSDTSDTLDTSDTTDTNLFGNSTSKETSCNAVSYQCCILLLEGKWFLEDNTDHCVTQPDMICRAENVLSCLLKAGCLRNRRFRHVHQFLSAAG